jgi:hypothetical protein
MIRGSECERHIAKRTISQRRRLATLRRWKIDTLTPSFLFFSILFPLFIFYFAFLQQRELKYIFWSDI